MNAFYEHHKDSIRFGYRCFDRILLNGLIQPFQQPERVVGFFSTYRHLHPVSRDILRGAAEQFQLWVKEQADKWNAPIVEPPRGRRDEFVDPYFRGAGPDQVIVILKAREPARIMTAIGDKKLNRWHLQIADRWIVQYNFYISDQHWGRMFVRMCPYLPFSARVCLNQHHWLANRMREEGIDFQQCSNAFLRCGAPERLQQLADTLTAEDLESCGRKWLTRLTPFFTETERKQAGCQHRLFFSQIEFCDNLIFHRRAALDKLGERLLDANRTIGQPNKITVIFGRKVTKQYRGKLQTEIEDMNLPNPVIRSHYRNGFIKQYVRDHVILRTEPASNNVTDYGVNKAIEHLPALRDKMAAVIDNYLEAQQDILETFVDRGQLRKLTKPTLTPTGKRVPGLKLDNPRQLALMHALVRFAQIPAARTFSTAEIYPHAVAALGSTTEQYSLASLRYDLSKLRVKGLVEKLPRSRRYHLLAEGYSVCLIFLKLFERVYAPLTAARLRPVPGDAALPPRKHSLLDRLYQRFNAALDRLLHAVGLPPTPTSNENKILVHAPINAYSYWIQHNPKVIVAVRDYGAFNLDRIGIGVLYYATGIPYILKSVPPFAEFLRSAVMEAPPFTPLLTNPVTVILAGFGLYRLWRRPDLQPRSLAMLRIALIGHASAVVLILMFFTFTLRYRFDFAPFMTLAAFVGYRSLSMLVAGFSGTWRRRILVAAVGFCVLGILGSHYILLVHKVWSIGVPMGVRLALFPFAPFAHAAFEP